MKSIYLKIIILLFVLITVNVKTKSTDFHIGGSSPSNHYLLESDGQPLLSSNHMQAVDTTTTIFGINSIGNHQP